MIRLNKLQFLKTTLRRISATFLIIGLLFTTYAAYLDSPNSQVLAQYFTPACTTDGTATGPRLEKVEFAGGMTTNQRNTIAKVRNCSTSRDFIVTVEKHSVKCDYTNRGTCVPTGAPTIEEKTVRRDDYANGGSYETFTADIEAVSCGSTQTDIIVKSYRSTDGSITGTFSNASTGTYYQSTGGACTTQPTATPTAAPTVKTNILGRVWTSNVSGETWQSSNVCPANPNIKTSNNINVSNMAVDKCDGTGPYFHSGEVAPGQKTMTLTNIPSGYSCGTWSYSIYNRTQGQWENKGSGNGCTFSADFQALSSPYDNGHHLAFYISKNPVATATPVPTIAPTVVPTAVPTAVPTPVVTPTPVPTIAPTPVVTPTPIPTLAPTPTPTQSPNPSPSPTPTPIVALATELKICKFNDQNSDGILQSGESKESWTFKYTVANQETRSVTSRWYNPLTNGCAIVEVPADTSVRVEEEPKAGWIQTAVYADGAKTDGPTYTYTASSNTKKEIWFLNKVAPGATIAPTPSPTPTVAPTATPAPTVTPAPTAIPTVTSNYNISFEKRIGDNGTRVDGDKVGIQYRIKIKNNSGSSFNNFEVRDTLPEHFTYDANTTEGDITINPDIQDVSGDDNRRLVWKISSLESGKELNFGYRTTGKREDKNYCNDALIKKDDNTVATSQACVRITQSGTTQVLGTTTTKTLPATGQKPFVYGLFFIALAAAGWKLSRHIE
jgi:uncharacterized repeat protein (TIGR01451 family)